MSSSKTIHFKIEDSSSVNKIMNQRGTVYGEVTFRYIDSERFNIPEYIYDGEYALKWSSSFDENEPYFLSDELQDAIIALLKSSHYDEADAFTLDENKLYDFSHFKKCDIKYMVSHDTSSLVLVISNNEVHYLKLFQSKLEAEMKAIELANAWYIQEGVNAFTQVDSIKTIDEMHAYYQSEPYFNSGEEAHVLIEELESKDSKKETIRWMRQKHTTSKKKKVNLKSGQNAA